MKYGYIERERRFLLKQIPADLALDGPYRLIIDRYLIDTRLRLRQVFDEQGKLLQ